MHGTSSVRNTGAECPVPPCRSVSRFGDRISFFHLLVGGQVVDLIPFFERHEAAGEAQARAVLLQMAKERLQSAGHDANGDRRLENELEPPRLSLPEVEMRCPTALDDVDQQRTRQPAADLAELVDRMRRFDE